MAAATTAVIFGQLVLGALMRRTGAGLAIPDFPLAFGRIVPPLASPHIAVHFAHRVGALVVLLAVTGTTTLALRSADAWLRRPAILAVTLLAAQLTLGALTVWSRRGVIPTTTHLVVGAGVLATSLVLTLRAARVSAGRTAAPAAIPIGGRVLA